MKTQKIEIRHVKLPMTKPFTTSFGTVTERDIVIVKLWTNMGVSYAESPTLHAPIYAPETTWTVMHMLRDYIGPILLEEDISDPKALYDRLSFIKGNNMAKHVVDTAMYHILSQSEGQPLYQFLEGTREHVEAGLSIGIEPSLEKLLERVEWAVDQGFKRVKIKIKPDWDVEPVARIRKEFNDLPLMVDANSAYTLEDASVFKELDNYGLMMIEQPLGDMDIIEHSYLQRKIRTPICLDESIETLDDARHAIQMGSCGVINIKPGRVGGLYPSKRIHDFCYEHQDRSYAGTGLGRIPVWVGGMVESAIGKLDNIAIATLPGFSLPGDIGPSHWYFPEDLIDPSFEVREGIIVPSNKPGIGYEVDEQRVEKYTVEKDVLK